MKPVQFRFLVAVGYLLLSGSPTMQGAPFWQRIWRAARSAVALVRNPRLAAILGAGTILLPSAVLLATNSPATIDKRHITQSWPSETVEWLKKHAVSPALQTQIDQALLNDATLDALQALYIRSYNAPDAIKAHKAHDALKAEGFTFLQYSQHPGPTVFIHAKIPGYVFKICTDEIANLERVYNAEQLRRWLAEATDQPLVPLVVPEKHIYLMPCTTAERYTNLPKAIVVASKIKRDPQYTYKICNHRDPLRNIIKNYLQSHAFYVDSQCSNVYRTDNGESYAIIDTETRSFFDLWKKRIPPLPGLRRCYIIGAKTCFQDSQGRAQIMLQGWVQRS